MAERRPPPRVLGYCTNVHAGASFEETLANLDRHAVAVKAAFSPAAPMGIGLWLSAGAARAVLETEGVGDLRRFLLERGLRVFTLNGFPHGDFHEVRVKHAVYEPNWYDDRRVAYTLDLAEILAALLGEGEEGSISTLPLGWPLEGARRVPALAVANLRILVERLHAIEEETGRLIHLDLEPEPGCEVDCAHDVIALFGEHLFGGSDEERVRRHLRVCHDVCHAAVMYEDQRLVLERYRQAGILVGKVQVSSALRATAETWDELRPFAEDRYLHQTAVRSGTSIRLLEDLPHALGDEACRTSGDEWRVHYHVPIFMERIGRLQTTRAAIIECLETLRDWNEVRHFEVETYTWEVLPRERAGTLAEGIAQELRWLLEHAPDGFFA